MKQFEKILGLGMLLFAIGFNLWLYRAEPTAMTDPNDNTFQFALVDRTNQIWDFGKRNCKGFWLSAVSSQLLSITGSPIGQKGTIYRSTIPTFRRFS